jgi:hypothetical protein
LQVASAPEPGPRTIQPLAYEIEFDNAYPAIAPVAQAQVEWEAPGARADVDHHVSVSQSQALNLTKHELFV